MGPKLDQINMRILEELQRNARITNQELAETVALSPSACLARVRKLEADGILTRFKADITLNKIEQTMEAFMEVTLENRSGSETAPFFRAVAKHPHVVSCHRICGHSDFFLRVVVRDMPHLREIADYLLGGGLDVAKIVTFPIMEEIKPFEGFPLRGLFPNLG